MTEEMSFQVLLEHCQGFSAPDEGGSNTESQEHCFKH